MEEITVANLIRGVEKRQYLLPTIQRSFAWESKKIETLFDSIMRNAINLSDTVIKANWRDITAISFKESVVS